MGCALADEVRALGRLDALVNNAAISAKPFVLFRDLLLALHATWLNSMKREEGVRL